ncbi:hypothetical protein ACIQUQ_16475 [Streptomyces sp. NPDC101118]|uniref:hypothetical protein n=1 Tax=Streptomyces sp. NPDC101118 TaxID=3366109 RepID=UPI00380EDE09
MRGRVAVACGRGRERNCPPGQAAELAGLLVSVRRGRVVSVTRHPRPAAGLMVREAAERLRSNYLDGVVHVCLVRPTGAEDLARTLAARGSRPAAAGQGPRTSWRTPPLAEQDVLVALDGSEFLTPDALVWLQNLLDAGPGVTILAAGRHPLPLHAEHGPPRRWA